MRYLPCSALLAALAAVSCARVLDPPPPAGALVPAPVGLALGGVTPAEGPPRAAVSSVAAPSTPLPQRSLDAGPARYPWLAGGDSAAEALAERFAPPPGFVRVDLAPETFGAWLRDLPLAPPGTPVRSFRGAVILPGDHPNLAAVVALDVGDADLQQCADSVIRLHAEWLFALGRRDASYRAASGAPMPFARWARGERMVPQPAPGLGFTWSATGRPDAGHASYRRWLDAVFTWANTGSLAREAEPVAGADLRPGDFVVQPGAPGHAVLVLDLALAPGGRRALLLGQGFMPAQSFHVLRPAGPGEPSGPRLRRREPPGAWFVVGPGALGLDTPFWAPFPWKTLHRFAGT